MRPSRNSDIPLSDKPVLIDPPTPRDLKIFEILYWHKFLPSSWIRWYFPSAVTSQDFISRLGLLRERQNAYLTWSDYPLNHKNDKNRAGVYELALHGAKAIGRKSPPTVKDQDLPHDFIVSLHEASLRFQARDAGVPFHFLEAATYHLPSGMRWVPDGHPIIIGEPGNETLIHSEIERRKSRENPEDTEEKLDNGGALAGDAGLTFDKNADRLTATYASTTGITANYASTSLLIASTAQLGTITQGIWNGTAIGMRTLQNPATGLERLNDLHACPRRHRTPALIAGCRSVSLSSRRSPPAGLR